MRSLLHARIHNATVTAADVNYVGSITIDRSLMKAVDLWEGERVLVVSKTDGERLETYVIGGPPGSGTIEMNGPAALRTRNRQPILAAWPALFIAGEQAKQEWHLILCSADQILSTTSRRGP